MEITYLDKEPGIYRFVTPPYVYHFHHRLGFPCSMSYGSCVLPDEELGKHIITYFVALAISRSKNKLVTLEIPSTLLDILSRMSGEIVHPHDYDIEILYHFDGNHYEAKPLAPIPLSNQDKALRNYFAMRQFELETTSPTPEKLKDLIGNNLIFI